MPCLAQDRHCLDVAEAFFDPLADALTDRVTGMAGSAAVDRGLACFAGLCEVRIDGDMRSYVAFPEFADKIGYIKALVAAKRDAASRPVQRSGVISSRAILGGLHHHYARL